MSQKLIDYINQTWDKTVRETHEDADTLLALPYPYTVPSSEGRFREMYYWDTYFTNVGLLLSGKTQLAKGNAGNMAYLINKYGFMPNGNRTYYLFNSQPPFFTHMIRDIYEVTSDTAWLCEMFKAAEKEYAFWQEKRMTPSGLNRYYGDYEDEAHKQRISDHMCDRFALPHDTDPDKIQSNAACFREFCESGWDCNSRKGTVAHQFNTPDQNGLLYGMEQNMAFFCQELGKDPTVWQHRAESRKAKMDALLWDNETGSYQDYNFVTKERNTLLSVAGFYPLFVGMADADKAERMIANLPRLENAYGVACCEKRDDLYFLQWDYPFSWACLQYIIINALSRYGHQMDALRIAEKYIKVVDKNFETTGRIWEKYNSVTGEIAVAKEYKTPEMMGWSAGIYLYCCHFLGLM